MKKVFLGLIVLFSVASCKKSETPCTTSVASLSGPYKITALTFQATGSATTTDQFALFPACEKDDVTTLNANGTYTTVEGATSCSPANSDAGLWSLSGNTFTFDGQAFTITSFNCSTLVMTETDPAGVGTITLQKQ